MGTPIYSAGSGTIDKVGWESGYGKYIRIKHANGYETAYGHMTAYRTRHGAGQARAAGTVDRLRRLDRPVDRRARALRNSGQRPLRRSDAHQTAARPRARRADARDVRERTRPARRHDDPHAVARCAGASNPTATPASGGSSRERPPFSVGAQMLEPGAPPTIPIQRPYAMSLPSEPSLPPSRRLCWPARRRSSPAAPAASGG